MNFSIFLAKQKCSFLPYLQASNGKNELTRFLRTKVYQDVTKIIGVFREVLNIDRWIEKPKEKTFSVFRELLNINELID